MLKSKKCSHCNKVKSLDEFFKNKSSSDGRYSQCRECRKKVCKENRKKISVQQKIYYQENRVVIGKRTADYRRRRLELQPDYRAVEWRRRFARKIGISPAVIEEYYKKQFMKQQAHCGICGQITDELCIDHNHRKQGAKSLRALLCKFCNVAISWFDDNADACLNASTYLRKYN